MTNRIFKAMLLSGGAAMAISLGAWKASERNAIAQDDNWTAAPRFQSPGPGVGNLAQLTGLAQQAGQQTGQVVGNAWRPAGLNPAQSRFPGQVADSFFTARSNFTRAMSSEEQKIEVEVRQLLAKAEKAKGEERDGLEDKISSLVQKQFEIRHEQQTAKLAELEKQLDATRSAIDARKENRDQIIARRVKELLGKSDPLDWDYQPGGSGSPRPVTGLSRWSLSSPASLPNVSAPRLSNSQQQIAPPQPPAVARLSTGLSLPGVATRVGPVQHMDAIAIAHAYAREKLEFEQIQKLYEKSLVSARELRKQELDFSESKARMEATTRNLENQLNAAQSDISVLQETLESFQIEMDAVKPETSERRVLESRLRSAKSKLLQSTNQLEATMSELSWLKEFEEAQGKLEASEEGSVRDDGGR